MFPKVTVLMPVYNGEKYLKEAIESILNQNFSDFEFVIIDDGSTDNSYEIINSYKDGRIRLYKNETNLRVAESLNRGIKLARGEYVARMDADDVSLPERLAEQVKFLDNNLGIDIVGSWVRVIGDTHEYVWKYESDPNKLKARMFFSCSMAHPTVMFRKSVLLDNGFLYNNMGAEDFDLWARVCERVKMSNINKVLLLYRLNENQSSGTLSDFHSKGLDRVLAQQIRKVGIEPTKKELAIHRLSANYQPSMSLELIKESAQWFGKIKMANDVVGHYDKKSFSEIIASLWYGILIRNRKSKGIWRVFLMSAVTSNLSVLQKAKFALKFLVSNI